MLVSGGVYLRTFENDKDAEWKKSFQKNLFSQINGGPGFILFSWWFTMVQSATLHLKTNKMKSTKLCQSSSSDPPRPTGISGFVRRYGDRCQLECVRIFFGGIQNLWTFPILKLTIYLYTPPLKFNSSPFQNDGTGRRIHRIPFLLGPGKFSVAMSVKLPWTIFDFFRKIWGSWDADRHPQSLT